MPRAIAKYLENIYVSCCKMDGYDRLIKSAGIIRAASKCKLAVCGSTGMHFGHRNPRKLPGDLDFVTDSSENALEFISKVLMLFKKYRHYGRIYVQNRTDWCPDRTITHYKVISSIHIDICVMVLAPGVKFNYWYNDVGVCVQKYDDIRQSAEELTDRDGKHRVDLEVEFESELVTEYEDKSYKQKG
jgi:hypothetical protein